MENQAVKGTIDLAANWMEGFQRVSE